MFQQILEVKLLFLIVFLDKFEQSHFMTLKMVVIHSRENTRIQGHGVYLNPQIGNGLYLNSKCRKQGGFIGLNDVISGISSAVNFARNNSGLIKDGAAAISSLASGVSDIKRAVDEGEKLKLIKEMKKQQKEKGELSEEQKLQLKELLKEGNGFVKI